MGSPPPPIPLSLCLSLLHTYTHAHTHRKEDMPPSQFRAPVTLLHTAARRALYLPESVTSQSRSQNQLLAPDELTLPRH